MIRLKKVTIGNMLDDTTHVKIVAFSHEDTDAERYVSTLLIEEFPYLKEEDDFIISEEEVYIVDLSTTKEGTAEVTKFKSNLQILY